MENNGYWTILTYGEEVNRRRFTSAHDAGKWANRVYGLGNWTLQWNPSDRYRFVPRRDKLRKDR